MSSNDKETSEFDIPSEYTDEELEQFGEFMDAGIDKVKPAADMAANAAEVSGVMPTAGIAVDAASSAGKKMTKKFPAIARKQEEKMNKVMHTVGAVNPEAVRQFKKVYEPMQHEYANAVKDRFGIDGSDKTNESNGLEL